MSTKRLLLVIIVIVIVTLFAVFRSMPRHLPRSSSGPEVGQVACTVSGAYYGRSQHSYPAELFSGSPDDILAVNED